MQYRDLLKWLYPSPVSLCRYHALDYWSRCLTSQFLVSYSSNNELKVYDVECAFMLATFNQGFLLYKNPWIEFSTALVALKNAGTYDKVISFIEGDLGYNTVLVRKEIEQFVSTALGHQILLSEDDNFFIGYLCLTELCNRYRKEVQ